MRSIAARGFGYAVTSLIGLSVLATLAGSVSPTPTLRQSTEPQVVPVTTTLVRTDSSGTVVAKVIEAIRSDGSMANMVFLAQFASSPTTRRVQLASGTSAFIAELMRAKSVTYDPQRTPAEWLRDAKSNCVKPAPAHDSLLGAETIEGYLTAKVSIGPRHVSWFALDYGCAQIQYTVPMNKTTIDTFHLQSLVPGEPAADLFMIPTDYVELPPSKILGSDAKHDEYYYAHRPLR